MRAQPTSAPVSTAAPRTSSRPAAPSRAEPAPDGAGAGASARLGHSLAAIEVDSPRPLAAPTGTVQTKNGKKKGGNKNSGSKGQDPWQRVSELIGAYSPDAQGWVTVAKAAGMSVPQIRGHASGKKGSGMNAATRNDIAAFISAAKEAAELRWGDAVTKSGKVTLTKALSKARGS